jgi:hypothetical protein
MFVQIICFSGDLFCLFVFAELHDDSDLSCGKSVHSFFFSSKIWSRSLRSSSISSATSFLSDVRFEVRSLDCLDQRQPGGVWGFCYFANKSGRRVGI